jgi:pyoverdine/dityrosine biosynthesis protein Dit1
MNTGQRIAVISMIFFLSSIGVITVYHHKRNQCLKSAQRIYTVLERYCLTYDIDKQSMDPAGEVQYKPITGSAECVKHIATLIAQQRPLTLLLVGFPFKSPNHRTKTLGDLPDLAERRSLEYLQGMLDALKTVYVPGVQLMILCDGIFFAEFFGVLPATVIAYEIALQKLAQDLPAIKLYTSKDFLRAHGLNECEMLQAFIDAYSDKVSMPTAESIAISRARIAFELEHDDGRQLLRHQALDDVVKALLMREAKLRAYINNQFPAKQFLRCSVHFSEEVSKKVGLKLSPTSCITPYHGVLVDDESSWSICFKKDVDLEKYEEAVQEINGVSCAYYRPKTTDTPCSK